MKALLIIGAMATAFATASIAGETNAAKAITVGTSHEASVLGEARRINVILPPDYETGEDTYPVVVMLDGGTGQDLFLAVGISRWNGLWGRSQDAIIVGVETVDRQRELLPATTDEAEAERFPTAGEAAAFRQWLADDVLPMVRAQYRHDGRAFLIGESAAGHFVAETWTLSPGLFDGYAALSPSLQWNGQALSRTLPEMPRRERPPMFLSLADEGGATEEGAMRFVGAAGPDVCFADRRNTHVMHSNTLHQLLPEALQFLLPTEADWLEEYGMTAQCSAGDAPQLSKATANPRQ